MDNGCDDIKNILAIDSELNRIKDYDLLLERILREARRITHADAGSIYVKDGATLSIKFAQNDTLAAKLPPGEKLLYKVFSIPVSDRTISGFAALSGRVVNVPDAYAIPADATYGYDPSYDRVAGYRTTSMLAVPLVMSSGEVLGVLQVINAQDPETKRVVPFDDNDVQLVSHFASNAVVAMERAMLTRTIILRMIRMAELRDPKETGPHVNRVAGYAAEIFEHWAMRRGMSPEDVERRKDLLKLASMLHDVGKVAISDLILKKPARFTPEEFLVMQRHTVEGARLFSDSRSELDRISAAVAATHHENWNGTGYPGRLDPATGEPLVGPDGKPASLAGDAIPIEGRIVAVADVYDALVSRRVYKEAWQEDDVLAEMRSLSGVKFDPEVLDVFMEILPRIHQIRELYPDAD